MRLSRWQKGKAPDGVWQILTDTGMYYCRSKNGQWASGTELLEQAINMKFSPYWMNQQFPPKWRGILE